jgi:hypothetical protein
MKAKAYQLLGFAVWQMIRGWLHHSYTQNRPVWRAAGAAAVLAALAAVVAVVLLGGRRESA